MEEDKEEEDKEAEVTVEVVHKRDAASQLRASLQYLTVLLTQELFQFLLLSISVTIEWIDHHSCMLLICIALHSLTGASPWGGTRGEV